MATLTRHELQALAVHDVIEGSDLRDRAVTRGELRTMLRRAHLFREHEDVFLTTDRPTPQGRWLAAVRRCGIGALLSHLSAAVLWRLIDLDDGYPHVTVPFNRGKSPPAGINLHRTRWPDAGWTRDEIPVTSLHRTIDDIAPRQSDASLTAIVGRAERQHALELDALYTCATSARLRRVLAKYVAGRGLTDSELEALFFEIVAGTSLARPQMQRRKAGGRVDFLWSELELIVEVDGFGSHRGRVAHQEDLRRDRAHWREGLDTLRYTWGDVALSPREIAADLELAAERAV